MSKWKFASLHQANIPAPFSFFSVTLTHKFPKFLNSITSARTSLNLLHKFQPRLGVQNRLSSHSKTWLQKFSEKRSSSSSSSRTRTRRGSKNKNKNKNNSHQRAQDGADKKLVKPRRSITDFTFPRLWQGVSTTQSITTTETISSASRLFRVFPHSDSSHAINGSILMNFEYGTIHIEMSCYSGEEPHAQHLVNTDTSRRANNLPIH